MNLLDKKKEKCTDLLMFISQNIYKYKRNIFSLILFILVLKLIMLEAIFKITLDFTIRY